MARVFTLFLFCLMLTGMMCQDTSAMPQDDPTSDLTSGSTSDQSQPQDTASLTPVLVDDVVHVEGQIMTQDMYFLRLHGNKPIDDFVYMHKLGNSDKTDGHMSWSYDSAQLVIRSGTAFKKCMKIKEDSKGNKNIIGSKYCNYIDSAQQFLLYRYGKSQVYQIRNKDSDLCLTGESHEGATLHLAACDDSNAGQKFGFFNVNANHKATMKSSK